MTLNWDSIILLEERDCKTESHNGGGEDNLSLELIPGCILGISLLCGTYDSPGDRIFVSECHNRL
jgi:hypothetical protein